MKHLVSVQLTEGGYVGTCTCGWRTKPSHITWTGINVQQLALEHYYARKSTE